MANASSSIFMANVSGSVGKQMTLSMRKQGTILGRKIGPYNQKPSEQQAAIRKRFSMAIGYAKAAIADPEKKALYQAAADVSRTASAFNLAVKDATNPPEITDVDVAKYHGVIGDKILVDVEDVVDVPSVVVSIVKPDGTLAETGIAVRKWKFHWEYTATVANDAVDGSTVNVVATDLADNETTIDFIV